MGLRVEGLGFGVQGSSRPFPMGEGARFRVQGSGFRCRANNLEGIHDICLINGSIQRHNLTGTGIRAKFARQRYRGIYLTYKKAHPPQTLP